MSEYDNITDFLNDLEESIEEESQPRGAVVAKCTVEFGFPIFVTGLTADERFFPAAPGKRNKDAQEAARKAANKFAKEHDPEARKSRFSLQLRFHADGAKKLSDGTVVAAGWKGDIAESAALWTMSAKDKASGEVSKSAIGEYHIPSLKKFNIMHGETLWVAIGFADDPYKVAQGEEGMTDEYEGEARFPTIRFIAETFKNEKAAVAYLAAGSSDSADTGGNYPPEYGSQKAWDKVAKMIKKDLNGGMELEEAAEKYEVDVSYVDAIE